MFGQNSGAQANANQLSLKNRNSSTYNQIYDGDQQNAGKYGININDPLSSSRKLGDEGFYGRGRNNQYGDF